MLIEAIQKRSGVQPSKLNWIALTASQRYKTYPIKKRDGTDRIIEHPSRELKALQRLANMFVLKQIPVHDCATAYKIGASIAKNAELHRYTNFTVRFDFKDFFPSFKTHHVRKFITSANKLYKLNLSDIDIQFLTLISIRNDHLTIGAPTSPILTNAMMFGFDHALYNFSIDKGLIYTRYADDLFISSSEPNSFREIPDYINQIVTKFDYADLQINPEKTTYLSRKYKRSIAGLVITPDRKVSIGRNRKREIKALIHQFINNIIKLEDLIRLSGLVAFSIDAEPDFKNALIAKYGQVVLNRILQRETSEELSLL